MPTLDNYQKFGGESILIFGPPKSGKTALAGTLAEAGYNLKWFDLENGVQTLISTLPQTAKKLVDVIQIPDTKNSPVAADALWKILQMQSVSLCVKHGKIFCAECPKMNPPGEQTKVDLSKLGKKDVVVIDSLSQLSDSAWARINMDGAEVTWKTYEKWNSMMAMMLSNIQQAPFHVVAITHEVEAELQDGTKKIVPLCATRNFSSRVAKFFGHVIYTEIKMKKFAKASHIEQVGNVVVGSRNNVILDGTKNISLKDILGPVPT